MKTFLLITFCLIVNYSISFAQGVGIGTLVPNASAQLDISSDTKGILLPRMNTPSVNNIPNPAKGLMVYDTTKNELMVNMGTPNVPNWKTIAYKSSWGIAGNTGTDPAIHFIGTSDNVPLRFRMNNKLAGRIDSVSSSTSIGYQAGKNMTGYSNTAFGYKSLYATTTGNSNAAFGDNCLYSNTTGFGNLAIGPLALYSNTTGYNNIAVGRWALYANFGHSNVATGVEALFFNTTGIQNTAIGSSAMRENTTGQRNVAVGLDALRFSTTGSNNSAVGYFALRENHTGHYNAALGDGALALNTSGTGNSAVGSEALRLTSGSSYNTAVGYHAGNLNFLGWNNTLIGADCNTNASGIFNSVALGNAILITASNQARIGNSSTTSIGGYANWSNISDGRYKKNVREDVRGLDFIMKLRPVTYQLDVTNLNKKLIEPSQESMDAGMRFAIAEKESMLQSGFIAQEVEQAAIELGYDFSGVDKPTNETDLYALRYAEFVVPLVKAVQEQQQKIRELENHITFITDTLTFLLQHQE